MGSVRGKGYEEGYSDGMNYTMESEDNFRISCAD